jgi:hypothetical protein
MTGVSEGVTKHGAYLKLLFCEKYLTKVAFYRFSVSIDFFYAYSLVQWLFFSRTKELAEKVEAFQ